MELRFELLVANFLTAVVVRNWKLWLFVAAMMVFKDLGRVIAFFVS